MSWLPSPEYVDWWYNLSWKGIIWFGGIAAFATAATVMFSVIQFWSDGIRDEKAEIRSQAMEVSLAEANARAKEAELALERYKAPREISPTLIAQLQKEVVPLIPLQRKPSVGAVPATVYNLDFAQKIAAVLGVQVNQGAAEFQVGPARGVVAVYVTKNEQGKRFAKTFVKVLNENGIAASAAPGLMENLFHSNPKRPEGKPLDPTSPGHAWVVIVVGEKP